MRFVPRNMRDLHTAVQAARPPQMKPSAVESVTAGLDVLIRVYGAEEQGAQSRACHLRKKREPVVQV